MEGFNVYLFGGTDGIDNFGDLWLFRADSLRWERLVAVGLPPSPRWLFYLSILYLDSNVLGVICHYCCCCCNLSGTAIVWCR